MKKKGLFITMEGPEGAGKSTQAAKLATWLKNSGFEVLTTAEPGAGKIGAKIRALLLDPQNDNLQARAEALLYAADRAQHVEEVLKPALAAGKIVICDRYTDSQLAYQGYGRGLDLELLQRLNMMATDGLTPDLTLLLQLPPEAGLDRVKKRAKSEFSENEAFDRVEQEKLEFHQRICLGYAQIAAQNPARVRVIAADRDIETIHREITQIFLSALPHPRKL